MSSRSPPQSLEPRPADRLLRRLARLLYRLPDGAARTLAGRPRQNSRGTALDPHLQVMLRMEQRTGRGLHIDDPARAREEFRRSLMIVSKAPASVASVEDRLLPCGLRARIYRPASTPAPVLLYLHGGGWVIGDLETVDGFCRRACAEAGIVVVSLDYRLAPEHPFPAALEDAIAAFQDLPELAASIGGDPRRIGIGGDSAGGNLSAAACLVLRDQGCPQPAFQLLIYPGTDLRRSFPSHAELSEGYLLTGESIDWFRACYRAPDMEDPRCSPLLAKDHSGLAPALVVTAGFDPLRDEGEAYARVLNAAGVSVLHLEEPTLAHGFLQLDGAIPAADRAVTRLLSSLSELSRSGPSTTGPGAPSSR